MFSREFLLLFGGLIGLVGFAFVGSRFVRAFSHGFSIRLQLFFAIWTTSMVATGMIGAWVIDRLQVRAAELALSEDTAVGVVLEIIREFGPKIALITTLLAIGAGSAAYFFGRAVAEPIERLTRAADAIARGDRHGALPKPSGREVRQLTAAFDSMRRSLEDKNHIEQFVADLSHELKNPVSAIRAATEVLNEGAIDEPDARDRFLGRIDEASHRLELLLNDLLSLARLEAGGIEPERNSHSLDGLVRLAIEGLAAEREAKGLEIIEQLKPIRIKGDGPWIRRAIENLVVNSIRYSPPGGQILIEAKTDGELAVIRVTDEGPGVPAAFQDRIFERFVTDRKESDQTGLGLAIVRSVAELHGGRARLISQPNSGGCFEFSIRTS
ncbi:MAG: ATP-binding protein [Myxococcota bacterium]|nr:ATP-binding protein [Myxococcota bacterium]